jgi:luciferase family oxidoreductase group 1
VAQSRFSILDLAPVRVGGTIAEALRNMVDLARHAERWGYARFWLAEHHNMPGIASAATSVLIGHVAGATATIRVGSGGVMLPNHAALVIAEQFGTLETLYPGRIDLGVGRAPGSNGRAAAALRYNVEEQDFPRQVGELLAYLAEAGDGQKLIAYPGAGTRVPIWLLGSTTYSAELAAKLGLPFAFASHFAPAMLMDALEIYRERFRPSEYLRSPYAMAGVPVVAADTDATAERLVTSAIQRHLNLMRGKPIFVPPPVESMDRLWSEGEKFMVQSRMAVAIVGGPSTVQDKLAEFIEQTGVDEIIFTSDIYDHADRLRSFELTSTAMRSLTPTPVASPSA